MSKKHIVSISCYHFAFDSIKAATDFLVLANKAIICDRDYESNNGRLSYKPEKRDNRLNIELTLNQNYGEGPKPKAERNRAQGWSTLQHERIKQLEKTVQELRECLDHLKERDWFKEGDTGDVVCVLNAEKVRQAMSKIP